MENNYLGYNQEELKQLYTAGEIYFLRYDRIDKIYIDKSGIVKARKILIWDYKGAGIGIARRGRHYTVKQHELESFIKSWKKDGDIKYLKAVIHNKR